MYTADQFVDDQFELLVAAPDGGIVNSALSGSITPEGDVIEFSLVSRPSGQIAAKNPPGLAANGPVLPPSCVARLREVAATLFLS